MNKEFGRLLKYGLSRVALETGRTQGVVDEELGNRVGLGAYSIQQYKYGNIPNELDPHIVEEIVCYCHEYAKLDRLWAQRLLSQARYYRSDNYGSQKEFLDDLYTEIPPPVLYVAYGHDTTSVASALAREIALGLGDIAGRIYARAPQATTPETYQLLRQQLDEADVVILLVSEETIRSEVLGRQLHEAFVDLQNRASAPLLLPVHLNYTGPLPKEVHDFESVRRVFWENDGDTETVLEELRQALFGKTLPLTVDQLNTMPNVMPSQTQRLATAPFARIEQDFADFHHSLPNDPHYIVRDMDRVALQALTRPDGTTISIIAPRQMGKTALLGRLKRQAELLGRKPITLDFDLLRDFDLNELDFLQQFTTLLSYKMKIAPAEAEFYWSMNLTPTLRCSNYVEDLLLDELEQPVTLLLDKTDWLFRTAYGTQFFRMLRSWHNLRAQSSVWRKLDIVLSTSTEPKFYIQNPTESPFNVGEVITLQDFTQSHLEQLDNAYQTKLTTAQITQMFALLHGHPYLTRKFFEQMAIHQQSFSAVLASANEMSGPFGDHLLALLLHLQKNPTAAQDLLRLTQGKTANNEESRYRLQGAGLIRFDQGIVPRCQLYVDAFRTFLA